MVSSCDDVHDRLFLFDVSSKPFEDRRRHPRKKNGAPDLQNDRIPLTLNEVRRLIGDIVWAGQKMLEAFLYWSDWRRRHQQQARRCHYRTRTQRALAYVPSG